MIRCATPLVNLNDAEQAAIHAAVRHRDVAPRVRERLEMVKAAMLGHDLPTIARWHGRSEATACHWLSCFLRGGVDALTDAPRSGRPARADAAYQSLLEQTVLTPPRDLAALEARHRETAREIYLVLDNGPCHDSKVSTAALDARKD